jgi:peptidoglycan/LPS O-acetylase OafA/YrhL
VQKLKGHIPVLDGIRGLAIVMVLIAHFATLLEVFLKNYYPFIGPIITKLALAGLMGVDLFFVLSGFLITGILLDTKGTERYFTNFYARRFLRIFPLYYGVLFLLFFVLPKCISFDAAATEISANQWWLWAYLTNFPGHPVLDNSKIFLLGHFWSLAVEEHYYLVWPVVVYSCSNQRLKKICVLGITFSITAGILSSLFHGSVFPFLGWSTISFSGGLMLGALCALIARDENGLARFAPYSKKMISLFGMLFFVLSMMPRRMHVDIIIHYISWVFFVFILVAALTTNPHKRNYLAEFFTMSIMKVLGKISYGLYVYHFILLPFFEKYYNPIEWMRYIESPLIVAVLFFVLTIGSSFALSWISWHVYEKQFLKLKKHFTSDRQPVVAAI